MEVMTWHSTPSLHAVTPPRTARRAGPGGDAGARAGARCGYCTTDHTKVAVPVTPSVSVAVTVTV